MEDYFKHLGKSNWSSLELRQKQELIKQIRFSRRQVVIKKTLTKVIKSTKSSKSPKIKTTQESFGDYLVRLMQEDPEKFIALKNKEKLNGRKKKEEGHAG